MSSSTTASTPRSVTIFCPDRHIRYDARMLRSRGYGGGITSRTRLAAALARRGHHVRVVCNCEQQAVVDGVYYLPLDATLDLKADLLIANTSGGDLDLGPLSEMKIEAKIKVLLVSGVSKPRGIGALNPNVLCVKSNFLRKEVISSWGLDWLPVAAIYNGYVSSYFSKGAALPRKDPYRLIYASYPGKGLDGALRVVDRLRKYDDRYHLRVLGSEELWGQAEALRSSTDSVTYLGNVSQRRVAMELEDASFSICLQEIREGFGLTVLESLRAGCCVVASTVGAYPELIDHGLNGILIDAPYGDDAAIDSATGWILELTKDHDRRKKMQEVARSVDLSWDRIAASWEQVFLSSEGPGGDWRIPKGRQVDDQACPECGGRTLNYFDGYRCPSCGRYEPAEHLHAAARSVV